MAVRPRNLAQRLLDHNLLRRSGILRAFHVTDRDCQSPRTIRRHGELEWEDMGEVYDRVRFGEEAFDFYKGPDKFKAKLKENFPDPADQNAIDQYLDLV
jgi:hypothetical protein